MKNLLNKIYSPAVAVAWNLMLVYVVYQIARVEYYLENSSYLNYTIETFRGGFVFDTSAIFYTNALYIVMMLFPWYGKETRTYQQICKWLFLVVNGLTLTINLADSVYFKYTMRRTTTTVFNEFSNEGNLGSIFGTELLNHWYLVVLFVVIMLLLWKLYAMPQLEAKKILHRWKYGLICLAALRCSRRFTNPTILFPPPIPPPKTSSFSSWRVSDANTLAHSTKALKTANTKAIRPMSIRSSRKARLSNIVIATVGSRSTECRRFSRRFPCLSNPSC